MIVAIVNQTAPTGLRRVEEFRVAETTAQAVAAFCAEYSPPRDEADYLGHDTEWESYQAPTDGLPWSWDFGAEQLVESLADVKHVRREAINARTRELILVGFEYPPASGQIFSLSDTAQRNLSELDSLRLLGLTYPFDMSTIDDLIIYSVPDAATVHGMYLTGLARVQWCYGTGNALKAAVNAATTRAEVDAVIDSR